MSTSQFSNARRRLLIPRHPAPYPDGKYRRWTAAGCLGKVEQYLDGYKVSLEIGNPLSVTFSGFEVEAAWGPRLNPGDDAVKWATVRQNKRISSTQVLAPGRWCPFDVVLPATEPRGFGYMNLKITVNTLSLVKTQ